jgi:hypothetical protein
MANTSPRDFSGIFPEMFVGIFGGATAEETVEVSSKDGEAPLLEEDRQDRAREVEVPSTARKILEEKAEPAVSAASWGSNTEKGSGPSPCERCSQAVCAEGLAGK